MKVGVICATDEEFDALSTSFGTDLYKSSINKAPYSILNTKQYEWGANQVILMKPGVGKVNATIAATLLYKLGVRLIVSVGVAGALSPFLSIRDTVISTEVCQHDFDLTSLGCQPMANFGESPIVKSVLDYSGQFNCPRKVVGRITSGDQFIDTRRQKLALAKKTEALAVDMESAAIGYTATKLGIPFLIIRSISDTLSSKSALQYQRSALQVAKHISRYVTFFLIRNL